MGQKLYHVYILANRHRTLYVGVTSNLARRLREHQQSLGSRFTARYTVDRLVYVESMTDIYVALRREKQIKGWVRRKKVALIDSMNPDWNDLSLGWLR